MNKKYFTIAVITFFTILTFMNVSFLCLLPALLSIFLAFLTHEVYFSLFMGLFLGVIAKTMQGNFLLSIGTSFLTSFDHYIVNSLADKDHVSVLLFTFFIGALVHLIRHSGGMNAIVTRLSPKVKSARLAELYTFIMGVVIFFDDFANTLIVGNSMRPLTDKFKISREKLSFIVDATAAPISSLMMISTWIGYEVGLIQESFKSAGIKQDAYLSFISSIPYRFYGIFMLFFILSLILWQLDFFSMKKAQQAAIQSDDKKDKLNEIKNNEPNDQQIIQHQNGTILHAALPLLILIIGVLIGLYLTGIKSIPAGKEINIQNILSNSSSYKALLWASIISAFSALLLNILYKKLMTFKRGISILIKGLTEMFPAAIILVLAWSLGQVMKDLNTADFVTSLLKGNISYQYLPLLIFITASITSFATGTSWGTMAILFPLAIPLSKDLTSHLDHSQFMMILNATIGSVLSGAVFGDHCSPISDTTILSSVACKVNHIDHVKTQIPYALLIAFISIIFGYMPAGHAVNPFLLLIIAMILMTIIFMFIYKTRKRKLKS